MAKLEAHSEEVWLVRGSSKGKVNGRKGIANSFTYISKYSENILRSKVINFKE